LRLGNGSICKNKAIYAYRPYGSNGNNLIVGRFKDALGDVSIKMTSLAETSEELSANSLNLSEISNQNTKRLEETSQMSEKQSHHMGEINGLIQSLSN
jgi:methyl-accepting chemotaxis protein